MDSQNMNEFLLTPPIHGHSTMDEHLNHVIAHLQINCNPKTSSLRLMMLLCYQPPSGGRPRTIIISDSLIISAALNREGLPRSLGSGVVFSPVDFQ